MLAIRVARAAHCRNNRHSYSAWNEDRTGRNHVACVILHLKHNADKILVILARDTQWIWELLVLKKLRLKKSSCIGKFGILYGIKNGFNSFPQDLSNHSHFQNSLLLIFLLDFVSVRNTSCCPYKPGHVHHDQVTQELLNQCRQIGDNFGLYDRAKSSK